jgi:hypothetical protein
LTAPEAPVDTGATVEVVGATVDNVVLVVLLVDVVGINATPTASSFNTYASLLPAEIKFDVPASGSKSAVS